MSRPLRLQLPGGVYHVTARGNDRRPIFEDDDDCARFLIVLASTVARYRVLCHAYCFMGNHYHLLVQTPEANLSIAMRHLNGVYTQRFNRRHERCGHVLQGRFGAQLVDGDAYLREVSRYIVLNPVRAGLVGHPAEWRWSSFRATVGQEAVPGFLTVAWVLALGGSRTTRDAVTRYTKFVESGIGERENMLEPFKARPLVGDESFAERLDRPCGQPSRCPEFPRAHRFASRPSLARIFENVTSRAVRNARAAVAVLGHGYALKEVAEFLGLHYATVSRALAQVDRPLPGGNVVIQDLTPARSGGGR
jgi:putative transposase